MLSSKSKNLLMLLDLDNNAHWRWRVSDERSYWRSYVIPLGGLQLQSFCNIVLFFLNYICYSIFVCFDVALIKLKVKWKYLFYSSWHFHCDRINSPCILLLTITNFNGINAPYTPLFIIYNCNQINSLCHKVFRSLVHMQPIIFLKIYKLK